MSSRHRRLFLPKDPAWDPFGRNNTHQDPESTHVCIASLTEANHEDTVIIYSNRLGLKVAQGWFCFFFPQTASLPSPAIAVQAKQKLMMII